MISVSYKAYGTNETQEERKNDTRKKVNPKCRCNRCREVLAQRVKIFVGKKKVPKGIFVKELLPLQVGSTAVKHEKSKQNRNK